MKKALSVITALILVLSAMAVTASAVSDADWAGIKVTQIVQVGGGFNYGPGEELDYGKQTMRGFAVSPDGTKVFGGFLNPKNSSAVVMFDTMTGKAAGYYVYYQPLDNQTSYPKGLDCDDRGYLYVGLAYTPNNGVANMAVIKYDETDTQTGFLKQVSLTEVVHEADPGTGAKVGINGLKVKAVGNAYYAYVVVNYDVDYLYRFNVTIPEEPVLDRSFGTDGRILLQSDEFKIEEKNITEAQYMDVDDSGIIYVCVNTASGEYIATFTDDGKSLLGAYSQRKAYCPLVLDDRILVSSQNSPNEIVVYKLPSFEKVSEFTINEANTVIPGGSNIDHISQDQVNSICNIKIGGGCLFFGDQCATTGDVDQIFLTAITDQGKEFEAAVFASIEATFNGLDTTEEVTTAAEPEQTTAEEVISTEEVTTAEEVAPTNEVTTAAKTPETTAAEEKKGCGSSVAGIALLIPACAAVFCVRRKKD